MLRETKIVIVALLVLLWAVVPGRNASGGSLPQGSTLLAAGNDESSTVEIFRSETAPADKAKLIEICQRLEEDSAQAEANRRTEVETYRKDTGPGRTEYRREMSETTRLAGPTDKPTTVELCRQLEQSVTEPQNNEVRVYRKETIRKKHEDWWHRHFHHDDND